MRSKLVRAGRSRALVAAFLSRGQRKEADLVCRLHYTSLRHNLSQPSKDSTGAAATAQETQLLKEDTHHSALERFASEFGIDLATERKVA